MKVSVDLDLTPEELRRLFGLPDLTPIQALVVERITRQVEKGMDSNLLAGITRSIITGGCAVVGGVSEAAVRHPERIKTG